MNGQIKSFGLAGQ